MEPITADDSRHGAAEARYVAGLVERWLAGDPPESVLPSGLDPDTVFVTARANRLEALTCVRLELVSPPAAWRAVLARLGRAYQCNLMQGLRHMAVAARLMDGLSAAGVDVLGLRGPFAALDLYGDLGLRPFADIDLLVPRSQRERAWGVARQAGYALDSPLPRSFFTRHHLHWRLKHRERGEIVELHWALDHPLSPRIIDVATLFAAAGHCCQGGYRWRQPCPEHGLLLACRHLVKHGGAFTAGARGVDKLPSGTPPAALGDRDRDEHARWMGDAVYHGGLGRLLDVVLILRRHAGHLDWDRVMNRAQAWKVQDCLGRGLAAAAGLVPQAIPPGVLRALVADTPGSRMRPMVRAAAGPLVRRLSSLGGFGSERVADVWSCVDIRRRGAAHALGAIARLSAGAVELLAWAAWLRVRKAMAGVSNSHYGGRST